MIITNKLLIPQIEFGIKFQIWNWPAEALASRGTLNELLLVIQINDKINKTDLILIYAEK